MSFVAWQYPIFLGLILLIYWLLPLRPRQLLLLVGSYFFYAFWDVRFLALILATSNVDYLIALSLSGRKSSPGGCSSSPSSPPSGSPSAIS